MNQLKDLWSVTVKLQDLVHASTSIENKDETITKITDLIAEREQLIASIHAPFTEEEKAMGRELVSIDQSINKKLANLLIQVKDNLRTTKKQKSSNIKYANPYSQLANYDGMFLDHKQ